MLTAAALIAAILAAAPCVSAPIQQPEPSAAGVAPTEAFTSKLAAAADYSAEHSGRAVLVMHAGRVVFERYDHGWNADRPHPLASGTKSFTGVLAMFAVQDGLLTLDEKACDTITEWKTDPLKSQITIRHLLTLSSGLDPSDAELGGRGGGKLLGEGAANRAKRLERENKPQADDVFAGAIAAPMLSKPGEKFRYGPSHFYAFGELLERKLRATESITQKTVLDYMHARLFDPIGLKVAWFGKDSAGHPNLPGGCLLTAREWIKFGEFVRLNGSWPQADGSSKQLLKPDLLAECFKPSATNKSYGLTWWLRNAEAGGEGATSIADSGRAADGKDEAPAERKSLRDRLADRLRERELNRQNRPMTAPGGKKVTVHMAAGLGKQRLYILPEYDLVVVRFAEATRAGQSFDDREFLKPIVEALAPTTPKPQPVEPHR
ncbi:MAG: serine hydrolase [Phycisphaerales bacterium]|nr:serine hydrolase [Phycisphaerales bacterium]